MLLSLYYLHNIQHSYRIYIIDSSSMLNYINNTKYLIIQFSFNSCFVLDIASFIASTEKAKLYDQLDCKSGKKIVF